MSLPKILIVDDKSENLDALEVILDDVDMDMEIIRALSGAEAVKHALNNDFALILMDVQMPSMDGFETISYIKKEQKNFHVPVIFLSAIYSENYYRVQGVKSGAVDFISKPIVEDVLIGKVKIFLQLYLQKQNFIQMAQAAEIKSNLKSEFLANMSHEIRTPMNGVVGMTNLLLDTPLNDEQHKYAEIIKSSADALLTLINDILDFSKIEAGKLDIEIIPFDLRVALENFSSTIALQAQQKNIQFNTIIAPKVYPYLRGDPARIRQILTNLVGNALKFTKEGTITVSVNVENSTDKETVLRFSVADTGIGIHPDHLKNLFNPFTQAESSTSRKYGGTGLGLSISKDLCEMMGGKIYATSEVGKGSVFTFTVCFEKQPHHPSPAEIDNEEALKKLHNKKTLVVDQYGISRQIITNYLTQWNIPYRDYSNATEALEELFTAEEKDIPYHTLIIDLDMPGLNGEEFCNIVRKNEAYKDIYIIVLTAFGNRGDGDKLKKLGVHAYLQKPLRRLDLIDALLMTVSHSSTSNKKELITQHSLKDLRKDSIKILIAEDNVFNQKVAQGTLRKLGFSSDIAKNGQEAIDALTKTDYDIVFMDGRMPVLDGYEATEKIRKSKDIINPKVPIVAMTADAMAGVREKCLEVGMNDYIVKPFKPEVLSEMLERWIYKRTGNTL